MRVVAVSIIGGLALALASCGDLGADLQSKAGDLAKSATEFAAESVDTKTACTLAGQSEVFCGCVQEKLGAKIAPEDLKGLTEIAARAVSAGTIEAAAQEGAAVDPKIRDALAQCTVSSAIGQPGETPASTGGAASTKAP